MHQPDDQQTTGIERLEGLLREVESTADPVWHEKMREIVQTLLDFHGDGVARIVGRLREGGRAGQEILLSLGEDDLVRNLLMLYDLHPRELASRVEEALKRVRPMLASHGGSVTLLECTAEGEVRLRLDGSCHGCPSSRMTLTQTIEEALYDAAPDIAAIHVEGLVEERPTSGFVPLTVLTG
jgi:Fe-S cluster biogenesis protein NfuA